MIRDHRLLVAVVLLALLGVAALVGLVAGADRHVEIVDWLGRLRELGVSGWLVFIGLQMIAAVAGLIPASLLGVAAGAIYGVALGFGLATLGLLLGAAIAFALARSALRPAIAAALARRGRLDRFDTALGRDGWRLVLLLRISPVMPFSLTSYALGLSSIAARDYAIGTTAALPALLIYVSLGALGSSGLDGGSAQEGLALVGLIATMLLGLRIVRIMLRSKGITASS